MVARETALKDDKDQDPESIRAHRFVINSLVAFQRTARCGLCRAFLRNHRGRTVCVASMAAFLFGCCLQQRGRLNWRPLPEIVRRMRGWSRPDRSIHYDCEMTIGKVHNSSHRVSKTERSRGPSQYRKGSATSSANRFNTSATGARAGRLGLTRDTQSQAKALQYMPTARELSRSLDKRYGFC